MDDTETSGRFTRPPDEGPLSPYHYHRKLIELDEHQHLQDATIIYLLRNYPETKSGKQIIGTAFLPAVNGRLNGVFQWAVERTVGVLPDFLIVLDSEYWAEASEKLREILVYHELCHCVQAVDREGEPRFDRDGNPVWAIRGHDVEEFTATVARYGCYNEELSEFVSAAMGGADRSAATKPRTD